MKEIQLLCYVIPIGMCLGSHQPSPPVPAHPFLEHHIDKGSIYPPPQAPENHGPQTSASSPHSIVCVGSSSARLLSGPAPQQVLYAQTDDTAALARQLQHKENNVLPRSFINTLSSPGRPAVNKGPPSATLQPPHTVNIPSSRPQSARWHQRLTSAWRDPGLRLPHVCVNVRVCVILKGPNLHMESRSHVIGLSCRVTSRDMCSVTRWCNKTFLSEAQSLAHLAMSGFVYVCVLLCVCLEVLERSWEESCKCPPPQQGQRWEPLTSEGTDCQGQLVWPVFIYLFLNKRQVVTLEKGTQTQPHMRLCTDNAHSHTHTQTHTCMGRFLFFPSHLHIVIIHLIVEEPLFWLSGNNTVPKN